MAKFYSLNHEEPTRLPVTSVQDDGK